jgi:hypothetical protein
MKAIIHTGTGTKAGQFTFYLKGKNGKVVAKASEHYTRKPSVLKTLHHYFKDFTVVDTTVK